MTKLNFTPRQITHAIVTKVKPEQSHGSKEINHWYCLDGKRLFRVTVPKIHGEMGTGTVKRIIQSLKLPNEQFSELVSCHMSGRDYEDSIRDKIANGTL
ncbi:MAG: hypothetical protein M1305_04945 [Candidatus Marsarchaeota archaeon]|nr:hypothetical protein [Candidatus Marsarchaeota archaeon]